MCVRASVRACVRACVRVGVRSFARIRACAHGPVFVCVCVAIVRASVRA